MSHPFDLFALSDRLQQYWSGRTQNGTVFMLLNTLDEPSDMVFNLTESPWIRAGRQYSVRVRVCLTSLFGMYLITYAGYVVTHRQRDRCG
jgi:hypothetical protein